MHDSYHYNVNIIRRLARVFAALIIIVALAAISGLGDNIRILFNILSEATARGGGA